MQAQALVVAALAALSQLLVAQSSDARMPAAPGLDLVPPVTPIHTAPADPDGLPYGTWAAGRDYKVGFHGDMTFVPYLGSQYPKNQPWSWRTVGATAGGVPIGVADATVERWHDAARYEYRRPGFVEAYDVRAEGLEQTFVVAARPAVAGAIVVTGAITTDLRAEPFGPRHGAIAFVDAAGREIVRYGESVAYDRTGRRAEVLTSFDGARISLTVPAAFVEEAEFPLTIDPLIGTYVVVGGGYMLTTTDVVRDDRFNRVTVCHARNVSAGDADCWATEWPDTFGQGGGVVLFADLQTLWRTDEIACAAADSPHRYCFAIRREFADGTSRIRYHLRDTGDQTLSANVLGLAGPTGSVDWRLDAGGTSMSTYGDAFVLVWQRDLATSNTSQSRIHAAIVDAQTGAATAVAVPPTPTYTITDCEWPSVNQVERTLSSAPVTWAVCWQESANGTPWAAAVRKVDENGTASASFLRLSSNLQHLQPKIAGSEGRYALAYGAATGNQIPGATVWRSAYGIEVCRIDWPHGGTPAAEPPQRLKDRATSSHKEWRTTNIAFDNETASHWLVTYVHDAIGLGSGNAYAARVGYHGAAVESDILMHDNTNTTWVGGLFGGAFYDDDADQFVTATAIAFNPGSGVYAHRIAHAPATPAAAVGIGCSPAGIGWIGSGSRQQIGCEFSQVRVAGAPANAVHFLMVSLGSQDVILQHPLVQPGCRLHVDNVTSAYLGLMPIAVGPTAQWQFPLPEFLDPMTLYFQDWHLDAAGALLQSTSRLEVPIVE